MKLEASRFIADSYFQFYSDSASVNVGTSKKLFSKNVSRPTASQLATYLTKSVNRNPSIEELHSILKETLLPQFSLQLRAGFNLALYGYGSKDKLLEELVNGDQELLPEYHIFHFKAFEKTASYSSLLKDILIEIFGVEMGSKGVRELTDELKRRGFNANEEKILVIIQMTDGPCMKSTEVWNSLTDLCKENISIIMTMEHHNGLLLRDQAEWNKMNLVWHDVTTMRPYTGELETLLSLRGGGNVDASIQWKGAQFVLASLTRTGRGVFKVLAEHQLSTMDTTIKTNDSDDEGEEDDPGNIIGLGIVSWYQKCQEQFLVSNDVAFRTQLTEFIDHELIRSVEDISSHNGSAFYIPFTRIQVESLLQICNKS